MLEARHGISFRYIYCQNILSNTNDIRKSMMPKVASNAQVKDRSNPTNYEEEVNNLASILVGVIDFSFALFASPFRLVAIDMSRQHSDQPTKVLVIQRFWPHQIVCLILTILSIYGIWNPLTTILPGNSKNPQDHLNFLNFLVFLLIIAVTVKKLWMESDLFEKLANFLNSHKSQLPQTGCKMLTSRTFAIFSCCIFTAMSFLQISSNFDRRAKLSFSSRVWWQDIITMGSKMFLLSNETAICPEMEIFLGVLALISYLHL